MELKVLDYMVLTIELTSKKDVKNQLKGLQYVLASTVT